MKPRYLTVIVICMLQLFAYKSANSQNIAINNTGIDPAASAMLDIQSTDKGLLIPQISLTSLTDGSTVSTPAHSLLIYNTNAALAEGKGYYYNSGTAGAPAWTRLAISGTVWKIGGNTGTAPGTDFIGTTDARGLMFKTNNIQSGYIDLTGTQNTSFGIRSLAGGGGLNNVAVGWNALKGNIMGNSNVAIGSNALVLNREGQNNIAIGSDALRYDSAGTTNVAIGGSALYHSLGSDNTGAGNQVLYETTTGQSNIGIGNQAGYYNTVASSQVFINSLDRLSYTGDTTASPIYIQQNVVVAAQRIKLNGKVIMPDLPAGLGTKAVRIDADGNLFAADTTKAFAGSGWSFGSSPTFGDLVVPIYNTRLGELANQPSWIKIKDDGAGSRGVFTFAFAGETEQEVFFSVQLPANWKEGSSIFPHVHWSPQATGQPGNIVWGIEYSWVNYNAASPQAFPNTTVTTATSTNINGSNVGQHLITSFASLTPGNKQDKTGSVLMCRFFRKGGDAADTYHGNAAVLSIDFHYEVDANGSRIEL